MTTSWTSEASSAARPAPSRVPSSRPGRARPRLSLPAGVVTALLGASGLLTLLGLWWIGIELFTTPGTLTRQFAPAGTFHSLAALLVNSDLTVHVLVSLRRVLVGLSLALLVGVPLGLAVGRLKLLDAATSPAFQFLRMISPLSWMPIAVMLFGVGDRPIYFLLAFAAVWPILLNTAEGVRRIDPSWLRLADSLSATRWETLWHVVVPGVLGHVLTGLRLSIGIVWIVLVPCEMLGVSAGLGYFILDTRDRLAYSELMAMVLIIGALGFALDAGARALSRLVGLNR